MTLYLITISTLAILANLLVYRLGWGIFFLTASNKLGVVRLSDFLRTSSSIFLSIFVYVIEMLVLNQSIKLRSCCSVWLCAFHEFQGIE